jgi:competence protein ComEC
MTAGDASAPSIKAEPLPRRRGASLARVFEGLGRRLEDRLDRERDQLALWLPIGFGLGVAAWFTLPDRSAWIAFLLLAAAGAAGAALVAPGTRRGKAMLVFSLAAAIGCANIWLRSERVAAPRLER